MKSCLKILTCLFLLIHLTLFAEPQVVISLGYGCPVAGCLRHHQIRMQAYPFDWVITHFESLYKVLEEDFENFFLKENLVSWNSGAILDTHTGILFIHDFPVQGKALKDVNQEALFEAGVIPDNFLDYYEEVSKKYLKRIQRFKSVLNASAPVAFVRFVATKEQAILLRDLLELKYPFLKFSLIVINAIENGVLPENNDWNERNIQNYYLTQQQAADFTGPEWKAILYQSLDIDNILNNKE